MVRKNGKIRTMQGITFNQCTIQTVNINYYEKGGKAMRLCDFHYEGGGNLEELIIWGTGPMKELVNILDETIDDMDDVDCERLLFIMYELRNKIEDLEGAIYRFINEREAIAA